MDRRSLYNKLYGRLKESEYSVTPINFRYSRLNHMTIELYDNSDLGLGNIKERIKDYAGHQKMETTEDYIELAEEKIKRRDDSLDQLKDVDW